VLAEHPIDVMLLATDLGAAKEFYAEKVGLVRAEVADLRGRGVEILEYDEPWLKTTDGVADVGFGFSAWFTDPSGNTVSLLEFKDEGQS
jgi:predicted enzyme related to lactoylglutathione lyase